MIVILQSLDTMLARAKINIKEEAWKVNEVFTEFDHVVLLTQDTINFTGYLGEIEHIPCTPFQSKRIDWVISRFTYIRWIFFFFHSFFLVLKNRAKIKLLVSINVDTPAPLFSMLFGIPCLVYYHYDTAFQVRYINRRFIIGTLLLGLERFAFRRANAVWITSPSLMAKVKLFGPKRIRIIPNWVDIKETKRTRVFKKRLAGFSILFVGRLHRVKQVDLLIRAFRLIHEKYAKTNLYILGDGEQRGTLVKLTSDLGLSDSVHFRGYVDQTTVFKMMKLSDVLVLPSRVEGNPRVLIEAMVNGLPVVATNVPGIKEMIRHMKTGYLIDSQEPENLAYAIEYVMRNKRESASMAERACAFADKNFSKENVSQKIRDELKSLLSK